MVISSASNSRVKPLSGRAHGTWTCLDAARVAANARHAGIQVGLVLEEVEVAPGHLLGVVGWAVRSAAVRDRRSGCPAAKSIWMSSRLRLGIEVAAGHRPGRRQAQRQLQQVVSRIAVASAPAPGPSMAPCTPPSRTLRAAQARWPAAILDRDCARRPGVVRPGRRNGPFQPNQETSQVGSAPLTKQGKTFLPTPNSEEAFFQIRSRPAVATAYHQWRARRGR